MCSLHGALNGLCVIRRCYPCIDRFGAPQLNRVRANAQCTSRFWTDFFLLEEGRHPAVRGFRQDWLLLERPEC